MVKVVVSGMAQFNSGPVDDRDPWFGQALLGC